MIGAENNKVVGNIFPAFCPGDDVVDIYGNIESANHARIPVKFASHVGCGGFIRAIFIVWVILSGNILTGTANAGFVIAVCVFTSVAAKAGMFSPIGFYYVCFAAVFTHFINAARFSLEFWVFGKILGVLLVGACTGAIVMFSKRGRGFIDNLAALFTCDVLSVFMTNNIGMVKPVGIITGSRAELSNPVAWIKVKLFTTLDAVSFEHFPSILYRSRIGYTEVL